MGRHGTPGELERRAVAAAASSRQSHKPGAESAAAPVCKGFARLRYEYPWYKRVVTYAGWRSHLSTSRSIFLPLAFSAVRRS